jgi:hypothetical protein
MSSTRLLHKLRSPCLCCAPLAEQQLGGPRPGHGPDRPLLGRDVPRHLAFSSELDASGTVMHSVKTSETGLRNMQSRGVTTLIQGPLPMACPAAVVPDGFTIRHVHFMSQVLNLVWPQEVVAGH